VPRGLGISIWGFVQLGIHHLGICTTGDFEKNTFGDFHLGIKKKTIGDFKIHLGIYI
jgi:hypothetical protein